MKKRIKFFILFTLPALSFLSSCKPKDQRVTSITLDRDSMAMQIGDQRQLEAIVLPLSATLSNPIYWHTRNANVATVDADGRITAIYSGQCYVVARSGECYDSCLIQVEHLLYNCEPTHAVGYFLGDTLHNNTSNMQLRLFENGLTAAPDGTISGLGTFCNLDLIGNIGDTLPMGDFVPDNDLHASGSFRPGSRELRNGYYYFTGTYLGQYTADGLHVVLLKGGSCHIDTAGGHVTAIGVFAGINGESVNIAYSGAVTINDCTPNAPLPEVLTLTFGNISIEKLPPRDNLGLFAMKATAGTNLLRFEMRTPLGAATPPEGRYELTEDIHAFALTLSDTAARSGTLLIENGVAVALTSGYAICSKNEYNVWHVECVFRDTQGRIIQGR